MRWLAPLALALGCTPERPVGKCVFWDDCGEGGACEYYGGGSATCSYADETCATGRRYGEYAREAIANTCVDYSSGISGHCDDAHPCGMYLRCRLGRCINIEELTSGEELVTTTCFDGLPPWLWGVPIKLTGGTDPIGPGPFVDAPPAVSSVAMGVSHLCVVTSTNTSQCFSVLDPFLAGAGTPGEGAFRNAPGGPYSQLAASAEHTCGIRGNDVGCWGRNASEQLDGTAGPTSGTEKVTTLAGPVSHVSAGRTFTCASASGEIRCWGGAANWPVGTLASGVVQGLPAGPVTALDAGERHACAIKAGGAWCWGANDAGQATGIASTAGATPTEIRDAGTVLAIAAGKDHTCAITTDHEVRCWGSNARGQLGGGDGPMPVRVPLPARADGPIDAGDGFTCALLEDSLVHCWGTDDIVLAGGRNFSRVLSCVPSP